MTATKKLDRVQRRHIPFIKTSPAPVIENGKASFNWMLSGTLYGQPEDQKLSAMHTNRDLLDLSYCQMKQNDDPNGYEAAGENVVSLSFSCDEARVSEIAEAVREVFSGKADFVAPQKKATGIWSK